MKYITINVAFDKALVAAEETPAPTATPKKRSHKKKVPATAPPAAAELSATPEVYLRYAFLFPDLISHADHLETCLACIAKTHPQAGVVSRLVGAGFFDVHRCLVIGRSTTLNIGPATGDLEVILYGPTNGLFMAGLV